jgi:hypothetical protein
VLLFSTPNLGSLLRPLRGDRWIGYQDPTHISLKPPEAWPSLLREAGGMHVTRVFADGFWDVPYIPIVPAALQKVFFGAPGGLQAVSGVVFLPRRWGESMIVVGRRRGAEETSG